jgi:hypothetical protein
MLPTDGTGAACWYERRPRREAVFFAALGHAKRMTVRLRYTIAHSSASGLLGWLNAQNARYGSFTPLAQFNDVRFAPMGSPASPRLRQNNPSGDSSQKSVQPFAQKYFA